MLEANGVKEVNGGDSEAILKIVDGWTREAVDDMSTRGRHRVRQALESG